MMQTLRHIVGRAGEARGGREWLAGGGYSAWPHCSMLWSVQMACHGIFLGQVGASKYVWWLKGGVKKREGALDALVSQWSEEGIRRKVKKG